MTDDLIARLRGPRTEQGGLWPIPNLHEDAADALEAKDKRIAELQQQVCSLIRRDPDDDKDARIAALEAALKPFVWENSATFDALFGGYADGTVSQFTVKIGDLHAARAAMEGK